jgi:hypothetical protein
LPPDKIELDYQADCSYCDITIDGSSHSVRLTPGSIVVSADNSKSPKQLLESFFEVQKQLGGSPVLNAIAGK